MVKQSANNTADKADVSGVTALYVRVSTDAQYEEGYSIDAQEKKLKQWCEVKDFSNYQVYQDGGWSGSNLDRPAMKQLISDIMNHKVCFLLEEVFNPNNVEFYSINENFDTGTSYGKAMIGILSVFAQLERENIRERTRMGMYERVKEGYWMGGNGVPFGYDYDSNQDILVPNEHADDVRKIYDLFLKGYSTTRLAKMFPVSGDRQIGLILDRITYIGKIKYNDEIFPGRHRSLIDENTWNRVQKERQRRSRRSTVTSPYLLTGLLVCGKCGAKMRYQPWGKGKWKIYCYSQQTSKPNLVKDPNCDNLKIDACKLEELIVKDVLRMTDNISVKESKLPQSIRDRQAGIKILQEKYDVLANKIKRLYNLYASNGDELLLETIKENQKEMADVSKMLNSEKASAAAVEDIIERETAVKNLRNCWDNLTLQEKQRVLRICINRVIITDNKVDIEYLI